MTTQPTNPISTFGNNTTWASYLLVLLLWGPAHGCNQSSSSTPAPHDTTLEATPLLEPQEKSSNQDLSASDAFDADPVQEKIIGRHILVQAVGQTPKSRDSSLSRQTAGNRAVQKIVEYLKKKGHVSNDTTRIDGATIEKIWIQNGRVYARAVLSLSDFLEKKQRFDPDMHREMNLEPSQTSDRMMNKSRHPHDSSTGDEKP